MINITDHDFQVVNFVSIGLVFLIIAFVLKSVSLPFYTGGSHRVCHLQ
ncbi:hypothetical protein [Butyrivibrio sp. FCS014]